MSEADDRSCEPDMLTLRQAASITGLSATTLRRYIKSSRLRARLVPGRYGPEYAVTEDDLAAAGVPLRDADPGAAAPPALAPTQSPARPSAALVQAVQHDLVPGILYRELLMKHEQLLVQYGMLRVSGQRVYETRTEAEERAIDARAEAAELARLRDEHAREIEDLKADLRRAELEIAARDDELRESERTVRRLEMELRNVRRADRIDRRYAEAIPHDPPPAWTPPARPDGDH